MVFVWPCIILDEKASISSFFVILTAFFKSVRSTVQSVAALPQIESSTHCQANNWAILDPFKEANNSSISLVLITLKI